MRASLTVWLIISSGASPLIIIDKRGPHLLSGAGYPTINGAGYPKHKNGIARTVHLKTVDMQKLAEVLPFQLPDQ